MIIGHVGVAFAAKWRWPRISLSALLLATFAPDIFREMLAAFRLPLAQTNLYSHVLPWSALLALAVGALAWTASRDRTSFFVVFGIVLSHVALDMISGSKPLWNNGPAGIDLGRVEQLELIVESLLLLTGWYLMGRVAVPRWMKHWSVPVFLIAVQMVSLAGSVSQRRYATRCLASPFAACSDDSWLTRRWETTPFW